MPPAVPSPGNGGSFEAGGTLALAASGVPKETALAFIFLYHLTQIVPGFVGGVLVLAMDGEQIFGRQGLRSEEHTSELQSRSDLVCRLLLEKTTYTTHT